MFGTLIVIENSDLAFALDLEKHLSSLRRQGLIEARIVSREVFLQTVLEGIRLIMPILSPDFFVGETYDKLEPRLLELHEHSIVRVIPVVARPCGWRDTKLTHLQMLPTDAKPVSSWRDKDMAWQDVAEGVKRAVEKLEKQPSPHVFMSQPAPKDQYSGDLYSTLTPGPIQTYPHGGQRPFGGTSSSSTTASPIQQSSVTNDTRPVVVIVCSNADQDYWQKAAACFPSDRVKVANIHTVTGGDNYKREIERLVQSCAGVVFLVSSDFIDEDVHLELPQSALPVVVKALTRDQVAKSVAVIIGATYNPAEFFLTEFGVMPLVYDVRGMNSVQSKNVWDRVVAEVMRQIP